MTTTQPTAPTNPRHTERAATLYLAFVGILIAVGIDIALPAFDQIEADLPTGGRPISLIVTVYFIGMALGQLVYGPLADRFGRRPTLLAGLALYVVGAGASALAPSFGFLLVARSVWGLGAAASASLRMAMARDLFEGDHMARVVTIVQAVFMIGPIFIPLIGELILSVAPWPAIFFTAMVLAVLVMGWTVWFGETLPPAQRRSLQLRPLANAASAVFSTRPTIGHILAMTFTGGAFFSFLGSSQPIIDPSYGRGDQFVFFFGGGGLLMVVGLMVNNRLIARFRTRPMALAVSTLLLLSCVIGLISSVTSDGLPSIWAWFAWVAVSNMFITLLTPMCSALALQPMGDQAGTAASVLGVISMAGGALLAALIDQAIDQTITPMTVGYLVYATLAHGALLWAGDPDA